MKSPSIHNLMRLSMCLLIGLLASSAMGQTGQRGQIDSLEIKGPHEAGPGELIRLIANTSTDETPFWIVLDPITLDYEQVDQGKRLIFSAPCKTNETITVMLLAQQMRDGKIVTRQLRRSLYIGNPVPSPPPIPNPKPPNDDLGKSPLYNAVLRAWPSIATDAGKALSPKVAENLNQIATKCAEGKISEVHMIWDLLSEQNRTDLQLEIVAWESVGLAIQKQLKLLALNDIKSHAFHLRSAAAAINNAFLANQKNQNRKAMRR